MTFNCLHAVHVISTVLSCLPACFKEVIIWEGIPLFTMQHSASVKEGRRKKASINDLNVDRSRRVSL